MIDTTRLADFENLSFESTEIATDEIAMSNVIAFTWNPNPCRYISPKPRAQWKMLMKHILICANKYFSKFLFVPELTQEGNIHIHGWYILRDKIAYYKSFLPRCKELGYVKTKERPRYNITVEWFQYVEKSIPDMQEIIGYDIPITFTHQSSLKYLKKFRQSQKPKQIRDTKPKYNLGDITKYFNKK